MTIPTLDEVRRELARRRLLDFTTYTYPAYRPNWHHRVLCHTLDRFVAGEVRRVMVFQPAQTGKSELVSRRLPAFLLGRDPDLRIVACSYSADLASAMNRDVQRIMDSEAYRAIFPRVRIPGEGDGFRGVRNHDEFEIVGRRGAYKCAGVGGGLTGRTADVAIIDDPVKNRAEAESQTVRDTIWEWYTSTLRTRLSSESGRILLTMTRWHEDDLAGRLLRLAAESPEADSWVVMTFPALAEAPIADYDPRQPGDALWPERYPLDELASRRVTSGAYEWAAMYQQRPAPSEGGLIKRAWWRYYAPGTKPVVDRVLISWDTALKDKRTNDYSVGQTWGVHGADVYLLRQARGHWDFGELCTQMAEAHRWAVTAYPRASVTTLVEYTAAGPDAVAQMRRTIPGVIAVKPMGDKVQRAHAATPTIEAGNVWLPGAPDPSGRGPDVTLTPGWVQEFIEECVAFPHAMHDDQVDALSQALLRIRNDGRLIGLVKVDQDDTAHTSRAMQAVRATKAAHLRDQILAAEQEALRA